MGIYCYVNIGLLLSFLVLCAPIGGKKKAVLVINYYACVLITGLKPQSGWKLSHHYLLVRWQYPYVDERTQGFYVSLCLMVKSVCKAPDFVNFDRNLRSGRIVGLAPESEYELKVDVYQQ